VDTRGFTCNVKRQRGNNTDWQCTVRPKVCCGFYKSTLWLRAWQTKFNFLFSDITLQNTMKQNLTFCFLTCHTLKRNETKFDFLFSDIILQNAMKQNLTFCFLISYSKTQWNKIWLPVFWYHTPKCNETKFDFLFSDTSYFKTQWNKIWLSVFWYVVHRPTHVEQPLHNEKTANSCWGDRSSGGSFSS